MATLLSPHFSLEEMTASQAAARHGWSNAPPADVLARMRDVTAPGMEKVRGILGGKIIAVSSCYRSFKVNQAVGGKPTSAHLFGYAVDFNCYGFGNPLTVAKAIAAADLEFDQLIHEFGHWVHISFDPRHRGLLLTIDGQGTRSGLLPIRP